MKRCALALIFLLCATAAAHAFYSGGNQNNSSNGTPVTANLSSTSSTIASKFVGLSVEPRDVFDAPGIYVGSNTSLQNLLKLLGSATLRVGGSSQDIGRGQDNGNFLSQTTANGLAAFYSALGSGWQLLFGLDINNNSPSVALTDVGYMNNAGIGNAIFQIGNEPDGWLTASTYVSEWNGYYSTITGTYPSTLFAAPDLGPTFINPSYLSGLTPGNSGLQYFTWHAYPGGCNPTGLTLSQYIATGTSVSWGSGVSPLSKNVMSETGGICGGGELGYTNVVAQAAWYLSMAINAVNNQWGGLYIHSALTPSPTTHTIGFYNAMFQGGDGGYGPTPVFYGMYLFSKLEGQTIVANSHAGLNSLAQVIATRNTSGNANILIVNGDSQNSLNVKPDQSTGWTTASVYDVEGTSCTDTNPTMNGQPIGEGGVWSGSPSTLFHGASLTIKPCGAVLVNIQS